MYSLLIISLAAPKYLKIIYVHLRNLKNLSISLVMQLFHLYLPIDYVHRIVIRCLRVHLSVLYGITNRLTCVAHLLSSELTTGTHLLTTRTSHVLTELTSDSIESLVTNNRLPQLSHVVPLAHSSVFILSTIASPR